MKKYFFMSLALVCLAAVFFLLNSCDESVPLSECNECKSKLEPNSLIRIGDRVFDAAYSINNNIGITMISKTQDSLINESITNHLDSLSLPYSTNDAPFGLALFFSDTIDATNYSNLEAVFYYFTNSDNQSKLWVKSSASVLHLIQNILLLRTSLLSKTYCLLMLLKN